MKKTLLLSFVLIFSLSLSACKPAENTEDTSTNDQTSSSSSKEIKRYGLENGSITYELSGSQSGTKTITWKDWGMTERTENNSSISAAGINIPNTDVSIMMGEYMYNYTPGTNKGTKIKNSLFEQIMESSKSGDLEEIGMDLLEGMGGKKTGSDTIAGKNCDVYEIANLGSSTCIWKALNLKNESNIAGISITELATTISTDAPDESLFELPENIEFKDLGNIGDIMKNL